LVLATITYSANEVEIQAITNPRTATTSYVVIVGFDSPQDPEAAVDCENYWVYEKTDINEGRHPDSVNPKTDNNGDAVSVMLTVKLDPRKLYRLQLSPALGGECVQTDIKVPDNIKVYLLPSYRIDVRHVPEGSDTVAIDFDFDYDWPVNFQYGSFPFRVSGKAARAKELFFNSIITKQSFSRNLSNKDYVPILASAQWECTQDFEDQDIAIGIGTAFRIVPLRYLPMVLNKGKSARPPRFYVGYDYVARLKSGQEANIPKHTNRLCMESAWRFPFSIEKSYIRLSWRGFFNLDEDFEYSGYLECGLEYELLDGMSVVLSYIDGSLPPLFEDLNTVGFSVSFRLANGEIIKMK
jgi:hypothetical protein